MPSFNHSFQWCKPYFHRSSIFQDMTVCFVWFLIEIGEVMSPLIFVLYIVNVWFSVTFMGFYVTWAHVTWHACLSDSSIFEYLANFWKFWDWDLYICYTLHYTFERTVRHSVFVAQWLERRTGVREVPSSIPLDVTYIVSSFYFLWCEVGSIT